MAIEGVVTSEYHESEPPESDGTSPSDILIAAGDRRGPLTRAQIYWLFGLLGVAAVLRIAWFAALKPLPPEAFMSGDQYSYWYYGHEMAAGRGYISYVTQEVSAYYPVGYPALLAVLFWLTEHTPLTNDDVLVVGSFHIVLSVAIVACTFVVGRRLGWARVGLIAAGIVAGFPNLIYQVTTVQVETTFIALTLAALAIAVDHDWSSGPPGTARLVAFGAVLAVSAEVRPFSTSMLIGLALAIAATGVGWRQTLRLTAVPVLVLVAIFTPWTIRNAVELDAFIPSSTNMGDTLCLDRNMEATGDFRFAAHDGCVDPSLLEAERNRRNTRKAIEFVLDHPDRELLQIYRRGRLIYRQDHDGLTATEAMGSGAVLSSGARTFYEKAADIYFFVVLALAAVGLLVLAHRTPRPERRLVLTTAAALFVIPLLLWGTPRFHQPVVPFFAIAAALALDRAHRIVAIRRT